MQNPILSRVMLGCLLATGLTAQTPHCDGSNDVTSTVYGGATAYGFSGPTTRAYRHQATGNNTIRAVQLCTGNILTTTPSYMTVELWDDTGAQGLPGNSLAGGTWKLSPNLPIDWQGTNLDNPVPLTQGSYVWVVWREPGACVPPWDPFGTPLWGALYSNGTWGYSNGENFKVRLFCNYLDQANIQVNGSTCAQSSGREGAISCNHLPTVGNQDFGFDVSGFTNNSLVFTILGLIPNWPSVALPGLPPGCTQNIDYVSSIITFIGTGNERGPTAAGHSWVAFPISSNPSLSGVQFGIQSFVNDSTSTAAIPFVSTNGLIVTLQ